MKKLLFLFSLLALTTIAFGQNTKKIAILQPVDRDANVAYSHKLMLRSNLAKAITNTPGFEAYDRADLDAVMSEQDFQRTGMVSEDQIKKLGQMTGAAFVLVSEAVKVDDSNMFITAKILNVETAKTEMTDNELMGTSAADIQKGCVNLAQKLLRIAPAEEPQNKTSAAEVKNESAAAPNNVAEDGYVDLGLPSGTKWKTTNEDCGLITYEEAMIRYGNNLPTKEQWEELIGCCSWTWTGNGYKVTAPNKQTLFFAAEGIYADKKKKKKMKEGTFGMYWSSTQVDISTLNKMVQKVIMNSGGASWGLKLDQTGRIVGDGFGSWSCSIRIVK
jgi:hypothetical protein